MSGKQNIEMTHKILDAIAEYGCVTTQQISDMLKVSPAVAAGRLSYLKKQNKIVGSKGKWAFRLDHLNYTKKDHVRNQTFNELTAIFYNIISNGFPNEKTQHP